MIDWREFILWWLASLAAASTVVAAKLGMLLWGMAPEPPSDPVLLAHWLRRRRWLTYAELSALPAFATIAVTIAQYRGASLTLSILIAMALGGIGFVLLLDGVQWLFRKRLGMPGPLDHIAVTGAPPRETTDA